MPTIRIRPVNLRAHLNNLNKFTARLPDTVGKATREAARDILHDSDTVPPMVPEDTGALRSTGRIIQINQSGARSAWAIVYGGLASNGKKHVNYAELVHDDLRHKNWKRPGSGPRYVEAHIERRSTDIGLMFLGETDKLAKEVLEG